MIEKYIDDNDFLNALDKLYVWIKPLFMRVLKENGYYDGFKDDFAEYKLRIIYRLLFGDFDIEFSFDEHIKVVLYYYIKANNFDSVINHFFGCVINMLMIDNNNKISLYEKMDEEFSVLVNRFKD